MRISKGKEVKVTLVVICDNDNDKNRMTIYLIFHRGRPNPSASACPFGIVKPTLPVVTVSKCHVMSGTFN